MIHKETGDGFRKKIKRKMGGKIILVLIFDAKAGLLLLLLSSNRRLPV